MPNQMSSSAWRSHFEWKIMGRGTCYHLIPRRKGIGCQDELRDAKNSAIGGSHLIPTTLAMSSDFSHIFLPNQLQMGRKVCHNWPLAKNHQENINFPPYFRYHLWWEKLSINPDPTPTPSHTPILLSASCRPVLKSLRSFLRYSFFHMAF